MKVLALTFGLLASALGAAAQLTAPTRNYNVSSPVSNGPYVAGQILPCTYQLFSNVDSSALSLEILLQPAGASASASASGAAGTTSNSTIVIAENADTSKTDASAKTSGNTTYYEHSINYAIPKTLTAGQYQVVFLDKTTNTQLSIPIEIRPASAATSSLTASATGSDASGPSSIFAGAPSSKDFGLAAKTLLALAAVAGVALML